MLEKNMEYFNAIKHFKGFLVFAIWLSGLQNLSSKKIQFHPNSDVHSTFVLSDPPIGLFDPIFISPAAVPQFPNPRETLPPMFHPSFPRNLDPILTGKCPVNFSNLSNLLNKTSWDCSGPLAALVSNVICCPQVSSLLHIFQGFYNKNSSKLVLPTSDANDCFSDIINILASRGANKMTPSLCSVRPTNLTGGSCPVKDVATFEKLVDTTKLLSSCSNIDPLQECCKPVCQSAITDAAFRISSKQTEISKNSAVTGKVTGIDALNDCKEVVYSWLSQKLPSVVANTAFRIVYGCKVNKVCPLKFNEPSAVIKACNDSASTNPACCSSLKIYISDLQKQIIITNKQAINCAIFFGLMLQKGGVVRNIYSICSIDLKDFNLPGCLLRSFPDDVMFDNSAGFSLTCDLNDNIEAPWPSSSLSSMSLCTPEMSLPAMPASLNSGKHGIPDKYRYFLHALLYFVTTYILL